MCKKHHPIFRLLFFILLFFFFVAFIVWLFDPFYQYHGSYTGLQVVLCDRDNQVPGSIRTLDYNSVLIGSSVTENFDSEYLDRRYDTETLKIIRASGSCADLLYYLDTAYKYKKIDNVFWCLDVMALLADTEVTLYDKDIPRYLHTPTVLDDIPYLYNKEILLEKIPYGIGCSIKNINVNGHAYDWSRDKVFSADKTMSAYIRPDVIDVANAPDLSTDRDNFRENLTALIEEVNRHEETDFVFFFPPYSMLWWDSGYVNGYSELYFEVLHVAMDELLKCPNVKIFFYMDEIDVVCDLNNYMDLVHYSPYVSEIIMNNLVNGNSEVFPDTVDSTIKSMRNTYDYIINTAIYEYY